MTRSRLPLLISILSVSLSARSGRAADIHDQLANCNDWLYLINPSGISLGEMAASGFDGVVTDYSRDGGEPGEWTPP